MGVQRLVDHSHPAFAELGFDAVVSEGLAQHQQSLNADRTAQNLRWRYKSGTAQPFRRTDGLSEHWNSTLVVRQSGHIVGSAGLEIYPDSAF